MGKQSESELARLREAMCSRARNQRECERENEPIALARNRAAYVQKSHKDLLLWAPWGFLHPPLSSSLYFQILLFFHPWRFVVKDHMHTSAWYKNFLFSSVLCFWERWENISYEEKLESGLFHFKKMQLKGDISRLTNLQTGPGVLRKVQPIFRLKWLILSEEMTALGACTVL